MGKFFLKFPDLRTENELTMLHNGLDACINTVLDEMVAGFQVNELHKGNLMVFLTESRGKHEKVGEKGHMDTGH